MFMRLSWICTNTCFYWQRRLRAAACEALLAGFTEVESRRLPVANFSEVAVMVTDRGAPNGWVVCEIVPDAPRKNEDTTVTIEIGKRQVTATADTDVEFKENLRDVGDAMLNFGEGMVYLNCGHTDMRKQINGLMLIVQKSFRLDPFDGALFVFCNKNRDRIKILVWDADGFWLLFKRLEKGYFRWPQLGDEPAMILTGEELSMLLGGVRVELKIKRKEVFERNISHKHFNVNTYFNLQQTYATV